MTLFLGTAQNSQAMNREAATIYTPQTQFAGGGFENAIGSANGFVYRPGGTPWTFTGDAGLTQNNTPFAVSSLDAPEGQQALFLQKTGRIQQSVSLVAGDYQFRIKAAQRANSQASFQRLQLRIDGIVIQEFQPAGAAYQEIWTGRIYLGSGSHSVELRGLNPNGGDNTALVDDFRWQRMPCNVIAGGGCEQPVLPASPGFVYRPAGPWTYTGSAGLTRNETAFTNQTAHAPHGNQVIFLQGTGKASLNFIVPATGPFRILFMAALRKRNVPQSQTVRISIDGSKLGDFVLNESTYKQFFSSPLFLPQGNHSLTIQGLNPQGGDNTGFVDNFRLQRVHDWQDPLVWGGQLPTAMDMVQVPAGAAVVLRGTMQSMRTQVMGSLLACQNTSFDLSTKSIMVMGNQGELVAGKQATPFEMNGTFTLTGTSSDPEMGTHGTKGIMVMDGGTLSLHGRSRLPWTHLNGNAAQGANSITLAEAVHWNVGDSIVIASTDYDPHQAEVRVIASRSADRKTLGLNLPLDFLHYGQSDAYDNGGHHLDMRAEVGLLSRNLKVQGDASSAQTGFGGHIMVMENSSGYLSDVELLRMGQKGILGRYPFHWHFANDVAGQYIKNASIHRSYNRVITVHASHNSLVEGNVGYDHLGHGFFLEAGNEMGNVFRNNLGILTRKPAPGEEVELHDRVAEGPYFKLPATYWITNPANDFIGNVAAGSEGSGFWQLAMEAPLAGTTPQPPKHLPMGIFDDNVAHSNSFSGLAIDAGVDANTGELNFGHYAPQLADGTPVVPQINRFSCYRTRNIGFWMRANTIDFNDCVLADAQVLTFFSYNQRLNNSMIVGRSKNLGTPVSQGEIAAGRSLPRPGGLLEHEANKIVAFKIYDGPSHFNNVHFAEFHHPNTYCIQPNGAAQKSTVHQFQGLTFEPNTSYADKADFSFQSYRNDIYSSGLIDRDGTLTGTPGAHLTPQIAPPAGAPHYRVYDEAYNHDPAAVLDPIWKAYVSTNAPSGLFLLRNKWPNGSSTPIYSIRSDGPATYTDAPEHNLFQSPVRLNSNLRYRFQYHRLANHLQALLKFAHDGDEVVTVLENVPSATVVRNGSNQPMVEASNLGDLLNSSTQKYLLQDNRLFMKHIGANEGSDAQFGDEYSSTSPLFQVCQGGNCNGDQGRTEFMTFADFEKGADSRASTFGAEGMAATAPSFDAGASPADGNDNKISWTMSSNSDAHDGYAQLSMSFEKQVWTEFKTMQLKFDGAPLQVFVRDQNQGWIALGTFQPGDAVNVPLTLGQDANAWDHFDAVHRILFRTNERQIAPLGTPGTATVNLYEIRLYDEVIGAKTASSTVEVTLPELAPSGASSQLVLAPNPTGGRFTAQAHFHAPELVQLKVVDLRGKVVYAFEEMVEVGSWTHQVDGNALGLAVGLYQVILTGEQLGLESRSLLLR